ncbi:hypothetical protein PS2_001426 [Malus domestica]
MRSVVRIYGWGKSWLFCLLRWGIVADMYIGENSDGELGSTYMFQGLQSTAPFKIHCLPLQRCRRDHAFYDIGDVSAPERQCTDNLSQMLLDLENALVEKKMPKENWL